MTPNNVIPIRITPKRQGILEQALCGASPTFKSAIAEIVARHKNQGARIEIIYLANELQRRANENEAAND